MGEACSRQECALADDCSQYVGKKPYGFWYDCAGQPTVTEEESGVAGAHNAGRVASLVATTSGAASEGPNRDLEVDVASDRFLVQRGSRLRAPPPATSSGAVVQSIDASSAGSWRKRYILGKELGAGQTAVVYEAFAASPVLDEGGTGGSPDGPLRQPPPLSADGKPQVAALGALGRKVALKRFNLAGTTMFGQEVRALLACGVHPHILRLFESYEGDGEDDALVLEYCEGGDIYELYAQNAGNAMPEDFVAGLVRQLLLALDHLVKNKIEHRDVKPENLLLCESGETVAQLIATGSPHLKLADFGWASVSGPGHAAPKVQPEGVGSLWYAPPELNPPVDGLPPGDRRPPPGKSDMWSVGVIAYLLMVGHSPFNLALRFPSATKREAEVLRLAALGRINAATRVWAKLSEDARDFVSSLIQPSPGSRLSAREAWHHSFMSRRRSGQGCGRSGVAKDMDILPQPMAGDRQAMWGRLDGFQRLAWLAVARAVAEPELLQKQAFAQMISGLDIESSVGYLETLAMELSGAAVPAWFEPRTPWADILRLAFRYLDADQDGLLGVADLSRHVCSGSNVDATDATLVWVLRWQKEGQMAAPSQIAHGLSLSNFRAAMWSTIARRFGHASLPTEETELLAEPGVPDAGPSSEEEKERMDAIAEGCLRFLQEEPELLSFGLPGGPRSV